MNRRTFILSLCALGLTIDVDPLKAAVSPRGGGKKCIHMKSNEAYHALEGKDLVLPDNPRHGDILTIVVDRNSLVKHSKIVSPNSKLLGMDEPLELDQMAIFKLIYNQPTNNWVMG